MRFKTFRMIVIGGLAVAGLGGVIGAATCCKKEQASEPAPVAKKVEESPKPTVAKPTAEPTQTTPSDPTGDTVELRPMDQQILDLLAKDSSTDKLKDAFPGKSFKANIYRDGAGTKFNRVKIDLNRNDKWDEKWSVEVEGGKETIKRQVAPADDEKYTHDYRLVGGKWVLKKSAK
jgi:hypothetical protein